MRGILDGMAKQELMKHIGFTIDDWIDRVFPISLIVPKLSNLVHRENFAPAEFLLPAANQTDCGFVAWAANNFLNLLSCSSSAVIAVTVAFRSPDLAACSTVSAALTAGCAPIKDDGSLEPVGCSTSLRDVPVLAASRI